MVIVIEHKPIESRCAHVLRRFQIRNHVADDIDEPVKWNAVEFEFNVLFKCRCVLNDVTGVSVFHDGGGHAFDALEFRILHDFTIPGRRNAFIPRLRSASKIRRNHVSFLKFIRFQYQTMQCGTAHHGGRRFALAVFVIDEMIGWFREFLD